MASPKINFIPAPVRQDKEVSAAQIAKDKELIEQMKKSITHKLRDPELAKKAAQLIIELLSESDQREQKKTPPSKIKKE